MDPEVLVADPEEIVNAEEEVWWITQFWTLMGGVACGFLANFLWKTTAQARTVVSSPPYAMGTSASRFSSFSTQNKMVLIVRNDLGMGKGKVAAQCAHAAVACYKNALTKTPQMLKQWEVYGQAKVALKVENYETLLELKKKAELAGLSTCLVHDAGRTQVEEGTATVLGVGPGPVELLDQITGHLKLL